MAVDLSKYSPSFGKDHRMPVAVMLTVFSSFLDLSRTEHKIRVQLDPSLLWSSLPSLRSTNDEWWRPIPYPRQRCLLICDVSKELYCPKEENFGEQRSRQWPRTGSKGDHQNILNRQTVGSNLLLWFLSVGNRCSPVTTFFVWSLRLVNHITLTVEYISLVLGIR